MKSVLRSGLLYLSHQKRLRRWVETSPVASRLTSRFVAGHTLGEAMRVVRKLHAENVLSTLDCLGESVSSLAEAEASRDAYLRALADIEASKLPVTISIKLTQFGLDLSESACLANADQLAARAKSIGSRVEIDMESSDYTDRTLNIVHALHEKYGCIRAVIQAYLHRSQADIDELSRRRIPVRLCKGAYLEAPTVAYPEKPDVDSSYAALMKRLLDHGTYPAIATHDPAMIHQALAHVRSNKIDPARFEFQMLFGVRRDLQRQLVQAGYRVRLYIPYGDAWYPYFMRRLAERPANVIFLARNLLRS